MACFLLIETSTPICSLALSMNGQFVLEKIHFIEKAHAALLGVFAQKAVKYARKNNLFIDAVVISAGPGSYTGLRIGVSLAKGLCYGLNIPLIAISTLKIMAFQAIHTLSVPFKHMVYCPMIDAKRMEVFAALYSKNLDEIRPAQTDTINEDSYKPYLKQTPIVFFGNGSNKCRNIIRSPKAFFFEGIYPQTISMISLAEKAFKQKQWVDAARFEPFYVKSFQITTRQRKTLI